MAFKECGNGHIYDEMQYGSCPYCNGGGNQIVFGETSKTVMVGANVQQQANNEQMIGSTVAPASYRAQQADASVSERAAEDTGKTVAVFQKTMKMEPVVGWFVCIEGPDKGKDYHILAKNNSIGRGEKMDICIKGDSTISRENHARLGYDEKHNTFHLIPGESANNIYIDDAPIYVPTKLEANTIVELGETKLMFVPFCNENFTWKEGVKE